MKKIILICLAMLLAPLTQAAPLFKEGVNYDVLRQTGTAKPEVMEFFSYYCPHCYQFEPIMQSLRADLPADVAFVRNPVSFLGREMGPELQRAYALAIMLKVEDKLTPILFDLIQVKRQPPKDRAAVKAIFEQIGVTAEEFDGAIDSFAVTGQVAQYDRNTASLNIRGVPSTVVNGKYLVKSESLKSQEEYNQLVKFLLSKAD